MGRHLTSTDVHGGGADDAQQHAGRESHQGGGRQGTHDVVEETAHSTGENLLLAFFRVISLDHANSTKRFGEASGDLGVNLATLAKNGADRRKGAVQGEGKTAERTDGDQG